MKNKCSGFTLLEILLVIGIIGILAAIVIIAINPGRSLAKSRDLQRKVGITEINKGLNQYYIDNGSYPSTITSDLKNICVTGASATSTGFNCDGLGQADLSVLVPTYLPAIPVDPTGVGYKVGFNSSRHIMLVADLTETVSPLIAIGTTTYPIVVDSCGVSGDATDPDCWSISTSSLTWGPEGTETGLHSTVNGLGNTIALVQREVDFPGESYPAAHYCDQLIENGHADWYLPALGQLMTGMNTYKNQYGSNPTWGGFADAAYYWSSTQAWPVGYVLVAHDFGGGTGVANYNAIMTSTSYQTHCLR